MKKPDLSKVARSIQATITKHSPEILTGLGIAGMITTTVLAVRATPKAILLIDQKKTEIARNSDDPTSLQKPDKLPALDVVKTTWKCYIPSVITGGVSIACLIGASAVNLKRNAALVTAYTLSETALKEYQEAVIETIGEKKEQAVVDAAAKKTIEKNPVSSREVIITEKGNTLCYDYWSKRYFKSDIETIRRAENIINKRLMNEMYVTLNEYYYEIGLDGTPLGEEFGWDIENGFIDLSFSTQLSEDEQPCLVVSFRVPPKHKRWG